MTVQRYSLAAIALHWTIALLLAFQISLGWTLEGDNTPELFARFQFHKSVGITILLLSLARLAIRLTISRPALSESPAWVRWLAGTVHWLFYLVMILGPITGWIIVSTARIKVPTLLYGIVPWPHLPLGRNWHELAESIHGAMAWLAVGLFALHIAGALRHQWLLGKPELQRMIPFARGKAVGVAIGALAIILVAFAVAKTVYPDRDRAAPVAEATVEAAQIPVAKAKPVAAKIDPPIAEEQEAVPVEAVQPLADWKVTPGGRLGFTARWNGEAIEGRFDRWDAAIRFSRDDLAKSSIRVTVDLATSNTGESQRDDMLKGSDFFAVASHPKAVFIARDIRDLGGGRYEARGTLELRGVSKPATLRFRLRINGRTARVTGTGRINRTAFAVGQGEWAATDAIAADVAIAFAFTAMRPASGSDRRSVAAIALAVLDLQA